MSVRATFAAFVLIVFSQQIGAGQSTENAFQTFVIEQAAALRSQDHAPATIDEWQQRRQLLREHLERAWGGFPEIDCALEPRKLGEFQRDGYRVEKLIFQTRPGLWMTANAYVPDQPGKHPAILHVHGHWKGAKQDPTVQARCIGCVKLGFFVLCVDACGAGERAIGTKLGEYHGAMTAATLYAVGIPLSGLQVYENRRAVDYLRQRPEVDAERIGVTGASGGGNQSMYAGAFDERLRCVVPTCSVGNYQAYLRATCCLCEVVPGALRFTEEGDVLGLAAHRGLMITSATQDGIQFSVAEAKKSLARAEAIASLYPDAVVKHTVVQSPHDYNQTMREAMYGWMTLHLKQQGDGSPIPETAIQTEDPETLRCFPGDSRPGDYLTIPQFASLEAQKLSEKRLTPESRSDWNRIRPDKMRALIERLGGLPSPGPTRFQVEDAADGESQAITFETEPGLRLFARRDLPERPGRVAIVLDLDGGADRAWSSDDVRQLRQGGWSIVTPELRATGRYAPARDAIAQAPDHFSAVWSLWLGRPLIGQWVQDVRRTLDAIAERDGSLPHDILVTGRDSSGVVALFAAAIDERLTRVKAINCLTTYETNKPYAGWRLGLMVPGILRDVGDIRDIAALVAPRAVTIQGGKAGDGTLLTHEQLTRRFAPAKNVFQLLEVPDVLVIEDNPTERQTR